MGLLGALLSLVLVMAGSGRATLADAVYVITSYFVVSGHLRTIGWQVRNLQRAINELDDLVEFSRTPPDGRDAPGARPFEPGPGAIEFADVGFRYLNQSRATFEALDVSIAAGEKVALVGESGAGKTSFIKLVQRLYDIDHGSIRIDGQDISRVTQDSLRRSIALVPQEPILFHRSLAENIQYARPEATPQQVIEAAKRAHAHEFISRLESGYETLVGERGIKLSGGERQRVALARAILADAPILILDEATSSLDSITEHWIQDAIRTLIEERTAILIAHRLSTIRRVDRILVFASGKIVEQGTHGALMAKPDGHYRRMFDMQMLGFVDDLAAAPTPPSSPLAAPASTV
jgi:ATP-binding cassette subfamily B protein